ncbi:MAG: ADP-ribosylglycohydrolase family protein [Thermodesulfobacteriota bacterium]
MEKEHKEKYLGAMVGSALGDAIGELAFRYREKNQLLSIIERTEKLTYTDDTAMAIGLAESILEKRGVDQPHLGDTFCRNFYQEPWRGYASGPPTIFSLVKNLRLSYVEAARNLFGGTGSMGNGAAMRIVPVGLFFHHSENLYEIACASAQVTHAHPVGMDGAAVQAWAIANVVERDPEKEFPLESFIKGLISFSRTEEIRSKMEQVRELILREVSPRVAADCLGRSVAVDESLPFAIYSFLRYPKSFEDCLFCAILNGGDRDTLGAMACGISGAYLGIDAIPSPWRMKLENRILIESLASCLAEI